MPLNWVRKINSILIDQPRIKITFLTTHVIINFVGFSSEKLIQHKFFNNRWAYRTVQFVTYVCIHVIVTTYIAVKTKPSYTINNFLSSHNYYMFFLQYFLRNSFWQVYLQHLITFHSHSNNCDILRWHFAQKSCFYCCQYNTVTVTIWTKKPMIFDHLNSMQTPGRRKLDSNIMRITSVFLTIRTWDWIEKWAHVYVYSLKSHLLPYKLINKSRTNNIEYKSPQWSMLLS